MKKNNKIVSNPLVFCQEMCCAVPSDGDLYFQLFWSIIVFAIYVKLNAMLHSNTAFEVISNTAQTMCLF